MHPNEKLIRNAYKAMKHGDGAALNMLLTPSTQWIIRGEGNLAGIYTGPNEIFRFWKQVAAKTGGGLRLEVQDVLANDNRAVAIVTVHGERGGKELAERQLAVFEIQADKLISATFVYERPQIYDDFWDD